MKENTEPQEAAIACNFSAIAPENRDSHQALSEGIFSSALGVVELPDGYGFQLPPETPMLYKAAEFIANERLCCPFFTFHLVAADGQLRLDLTGTPEVKSFIKTGMVDPIQQSGRFDPALNALIIAANPLGEAGAGTQPA